MKKNTISKIIISCLVSIAPVFVLAQNAEATNSKLFSVNLNWILLSIAFGLLIPIYITGKALLFALKQHYKNKGGKGNLSKKAGLLLFFLVSGHLLQAQTLNAADISADLLSWIILGVIAVETLLIVLFSVQTLQFLKPEVQKEMKEVNAPEKTKNWFARWWDKINNFKPLSEESNIDTGHDYDGILELDNITPPWFITGFVLTILFAIVYFYRYHIGKTAPLQIEEYNIEMARAEKARTKPGAEKTETIDENNVTLLTGADIEAGKKLYLNSCAACHGTSGGSMPGGVGPNLADEYWIHGGKLEDIYKSIKYGWPDKGMISWQNNFSPKQIAQISSFIKSIQGSRPPGAKEPQGELFKDENPVTNDTTISQ